MDREVVHEHNGILLSHKKEQNCANCGDMDGPRDCCREQRKSEQLISYMNAEMWNLEKWYRETLCKVEIETDAENKCMDTKR